MSEAMEWAMEPSRVPSRRCAVEGCRTVLSLHNKGTQCLMHQNEETRLKLPVEVKPESVLCSSGCGTRLQARCLEEGICRACRMKAFAEANRQERDAVQRMEARMRGVVAKPSVLVGERTGTRMVACAKACGAELPADQLQDGVCRVCVSLAARKRPAGVTKLLALTQAEHEMNQVWARLSEDERLEVLRKAPDETYAKVQAWARELGQGVAA